MGMEGVWREQGGGSVRVRCMQSDANLPTRGLAFPSLLVVYSFGLCEELTELARSFVRRTARQILPSIHHYLSEMMKSTAKHVFRAASRGARLIFGNGSNVSARENIGARKYWGRGKGWMEDRAILWTLVNIGMFRATKVQITYKVQDYS